MSGNRKSIRDDMIPHLQAQNPTPSESFLYAFHIPQLSKIIIITIRQ